mmetsp:Transcript_62044/g.72541  ORF Transcript_62044/g.72541 Transcript_62044/m.72541 type:complete len:269 (-) Transcript_62044:152-958(-)
MVYSVYLTGGCLPNGITPEIETSIVIPSEIIEEKENIEAIRREIDEGLPREGHSETELLNKDINDLRNLIEMLSSSLEESQKESADIREESVTSIAAVEKSFTDERMRLEDTIEENKRKYEEAVAKIKANAAIERVQLKNEIVKNREETLKIMSTQNNAQTCRVDNLAKELLFLKGKMSSITTSITVFLAEQIKVEESINKIQESMNSAERTRTLFLESSNKQKTIMKKALGNLSDGVDDNTIETLDAVVQNEMKKETPGVTAPIARE